MTHPATDSAPGRGRWLLAQAVLLVFFALLITWVVDRNTPQPLPELRIAAGEKLSCVSYAPYHRARQSPFTKGFVVSQEQLRKDLGRIANYADCVRIYSVSQGLDRIPAIAGELGLKVLLGAWIGRESADNERELLTAIALANTHPGVVKALIVGNEVLLRREQDEEAMRAYIRRAKASVPVPVTYADVWEFWLKHDSLATEVDFVTTHILPFWEDEPVAIEHAAEHVATIREKVGQHFAGKKILIGETGWPSLGRQREESRPSLVNEARYFRDFINIAHERGWDYNFIEAIDQPWKRKLEGTVGGYWGILAADTLEPKFPLGAGSAQLAESSNLTQVLYGAAAGLTLCLLLALWRRLPLHSMITAALLGASCGALALLQWEHMHQAYRNAEEWLVLGAVSLLAVLVAPAAVLAGLRPLPAAEHGWQALRSHGASALPAASVLRAALLFAAAVAALLLWVDPRYRDFPLTLYAMPALVFGVLPLLLYGRGRYPVGRAEILCALLIAIAVPLRWLHEPANPQALLWLVTGLGVAAAALAPPHLRARQHQ